MNLFKFKYSPPTIIKQLFNDFQWDSVSENILLTFDDGPNPDTTEIILRELDKYSIKAVFFCVGENIERYPQLAEEIIAEGHSLGNHTYKHNKMTTSSAKEITDSIIYLQNLVRDKLGYEIKHFRPPHGRFNLSTKKIMNQTGLVNVMWSLLTYDYKNDINIVKLAVQKYLQGNSIIVLHDSNKSKSIISDSINLIVENAEKKKFTIGTPSECLRFYSQ